MAASNLPSVLIFEPFHSTFYNALTPKFNLVKPWESSLPKDEFLAVHAKDTIRVMICYGPTPDVDRELLDKLPKLECVMTASAGLDHIDLVECRMRGIKVCNAGGVFSDDVADFAVGLLIDVLRGVSAADRFVRRGLWPVEKEFRPHSALGGKQVGIVGLGGIGSRIATRLEAFGCIISYTSRTKKPSYRYKYFYNVLDLAADSNVLILSCALTSETHHIINRDVMLALGNKGVLINVGRGPLIDEKEMVRCLKEGEIGGAGLDVFENEPIVPEELFGMDNVVLCHHRAASTVESFEDLALLVRDNLDAFFATRPLITPV